MPEPRRRLIVSTFAVVILGVIPVSAAAANVALTSSHVVAHFDYGRGQTPENIAVEPDGTADLTFAFAAQVARVSRDGRINILAQLPSARNGPGCRTPVHPGLPAVTTGLARDQHGTLYVGLCTGSSDLPGIWRLGRDGALTRVAALPERGLPNGLVLDESHGLIYVSDSFLATIWRISLGDGTVTAWARGPELAPSRAVPVGANGLTVHSDAVWVTNTAQGTLLCIGIKTDGSSGPMQTIVGGLQGGIDDFAFIGSEPEDDILAAFLFSSEVRLITPSGTQATLLSARDGLSNPSSVAVRGSHVYVISGAVFTHQDPNLLIAHLDRDSADG